MVPTDNVKSHPKVGIMLETFLSPTVHAAYCHDRLIAIQTMVQSMSGLLKLCIHISHASYVLTLSEGALQARQLLVTLICALACHCALDPVHDWF